MSTITIDQPRYGTPFDQVVRAQSTARRAAGTAPKPHPVVCWPAAPVIAPTRSHQQRIEALAVANSTRSKRAKMKRDIKSGRLLIGVLLVDPPQHIYTMKVFDLMLAAPKYGRVKVNKILSTCRISPSKTIGGLSQRQRTEIVERLSGL